MSANKIELLMRSFIDEIKSDFEVETIGLELSYVDHQSQVLEIFQLATTQYKEKVNQGFDKLGSLLISENTFNSKIDGIDDCFLENIYEGFSEKNSEINKETVNNLNFQITSLDFSTSKNKTKITHKDWIEWYKTDFSGEYVFVGFRKNNDFDLVVFAVLNGSDNKVEIKKKFNDFLHYQAISIVFERLRNSKKDLISKATRSAVSQVLIRTMRHNFGHVMDRFIKPVDITKYAEKKQYVEIDGSLSKETYKEEDPVLEYNISNFNNYLNNRIALLADIATADPCMETPMSVKSLFKGIDESRIILNRISGIDSFNYSIEFQINGKPLTEQNDFQISMTNDVLGAQAFYIIIENIIRNVAKHARPENCSLDNPVKIIVNFKNWDKNPSFYEVNIYDNVWKNKDKFLHVKENENENEGIVLKRNKTFEKTILDSDYSLRSTELGTIEMDICSAYLRTKPVNIVDEDEYNLSKCWDKNDDVEGIVNEDSLNPQNPLLMYAYCQPKDDDKNMGSLGYKFFIKKPKEILVVDDSKNFELQSIKKDKLEDIGIKVITSEDINGNSLYNHQILYVYNSKDEIKNKLNEFYSLIPKRIVIEDNTKNIENYTTERFFEYVWVRYLRDKEYKDKYVFKKLTKNYKFLIENSNQLEIERNDADKSNPNHEYYIDDHHKKYEIEKEKYYEMVASHHSIKKVINLLPDAWEKSLYNDKITMYKYIENLNTKIVVLDERIQENILKRKIAETVPLHNYFKKQNLIIPELSEANLNVPNFHDSVIQENKSHKLKLEDFIGEHKDADFFIVHLGILEKLIEEKGDKDENLKKYINEHFPDQKKLIITTGRGNPDNLPKELNFLSFVSIQTAIDNLFDKFYLTQLIYNTKKHIRNEYISIY